MNDQNANSNESNEVIDEYSKPEQFCFGVEEHEGTPIVTICPVAYFQQNGYQDDQYYDDIARFLEEHDFYAVMECSFTSDDESLTKEQVHAKFLELGFKQLPEYDKYIEETAGEFEFEISEEENDDDDNDALAVDLILHDEDEEEDVTEER